MFGIYYKLPSISENIRYLYFTKSAHLVSYFQINTFMTTRIFLAYLIEKSLASLSRLLIRYVTDDFATAIYLWIYVQNV